MSGLRLSVIAAMTVVGGLAALAETAKPIDFSGEWWSLRCARISLAENGDRLTGGYSPKTGTGERHTLPLTGFRSGVDLIAFVVNFGANGPISGWAGQHTVQEGAEKIVTLWHMTTDVPDEEEEQDLYKSIWTGADTFVRSRPAHCK